MSPAHPLQKWSAEQGLPLTLRAEDTTDITLRLECALSELIPALVAMDLDSYLQQISVQYNQQWPQKKLGDMTPEMFWARQGDSF